MNRQKRRGANAIEFALTFPVLVLMLAAMVDYGWYFGQRQWVLGAVREASRAGALASQDDDAVALATTRANAMLTQAGLNPSNATVEVGFTGDPPNVMIEVEVSHPFTPLMGTLSILGPVAYPDTLNARLVARMEDQG